MLDDLVIQADDTTPIFQQLENQLLRFIRAGRLKPNDELPSVRAMAAHLAINPMTVSKTINRLVESGWLVRRRGRPTCVAEPLPELSQEKIDEQFQRDITRLVKHAKQLSMTQAAVVKLIQTTWEKEN